MHGSPPPRALVSALAVALAASACTAAGPRRAGGALPPAGPPGARADYERTLALDGVASGAEARWMRAGAAALGAPIRVGAPYEESLIFEAERPVALGYRMRLRRGQTFRAELSGLSPDGFLMELYEMILPESDQLVLAARAAAGDPGLRVRVPRTGEYILRVQPKLGRSGRVRVRFGDGRAAAPSGLLFPVAGRSASAIRSRFGDPRDGGRRRHHGVDIFAPRGTPVLSARPGQVVEVRRTGIGGRVIWLRTDDPDLYLYYAHLDEQLVRAGQRVAIGDTIGRVGNTGNARTTPPHLHFGVYLLGDVPLDPEPYLRRPVLAAVDADPALLGRWGRTIDQTTLRNAPDFTGRPTRTLARHAELRLIGGTGGWYRVRLPDEDTGFIAAGDIGVADERPGSGSDSDSGSSH